MAASSVEAMDRMIRMLTQLDQALVEAENQLKRDYDIVGAEWNDKQYERLGDVIGEISTSIGASYSKVSECTIRVQQLKRALEDYLNA